MLDPARDPRFIATHRSSRDSGDDLWEGRYLDPDPARVSHFSVYQCDTLAGSYTLYASSVAGVFATSGLDTRSKKR